MRYWAQENPQVVAAFLEKHPEFSQYTTGTGTETGAPVARRDSVAVPPIISGEKAPQPEEQSDARKDVDSGAGPHVATKADTEDLEKVALDTMCVPCFSSSSGG